MKVGTGGNLGLSREYHKKLFGSLFYTWCLCPLKRVHKLKDILDRDVNFIFKRRRAIDVQWFPVLMLFRQIVTSYEFMINYVSLVL